MRTVQSLVSGPVQLAWIARTPVHARQLRDDASQFHADQQPICCFRHCPALIFADSGDGCEIPVISVGAGVVFCGSDGFAEAYFAELPREFSHEY